MSERRYPIKVCYKVNVNGGKCYIALTLSRKATKQLNLVKLKDK